MTIRKLVKLVDAHRASRSSWVGTCPAHKDATAALAIRQGPRGRIQLKCSAGCDLDEILAALGSEDCDKFVAAPFNRKEARQRARERVTRD